MSRRHAVRLAFVLAWMMAALSATFGGGGVDMSYVMPQVRIPQPGPRDCQVPALTLTDVQQISATKTSMKVVNTTMSALTEYLVIEVNTASGPRYYYVEAPVAANATRLVDVTISSSISFTSATFHLCPNRPIGIIDDPSPIVSVTTNTPLY